MCFITEAIAASDDASSTTTRADDRGAFLITLVSEEGSSLSSEGGSIAHLVGEESDSNLHVHDVGSQPTVLDTATSEVPGVGCSDALLIPLESAPSADSTKVVQIPLKSEIAAVIPSLDDSFAIPESEADSTASSKNASEELPELESLTISPSAVHDESTAFLIPLANEPTAFLVPL
jgi:hypothetical protein